ncbi:MAG: ribonuclease J [bacterium]|nr:ribonuclease J [bacterium]
MTIKQEECMRVIPLGGLGEVGRNMMLIEYGNKILIIDIGFRMPEYDMPGIDYIIPNISYLKGKEKDIVGVLITHGHYDHIGAIPYILPRIGNPILYAGNMAKAIILKRQDDFKDQPKPKIIIVEDRKKFRLGPFEVEPFRQTHSIMDNFGFVVTTPVGSVVNTSDFKFDNNPVNEPPSDYEHIKEIGEKGVLMLMSDSTNSEEPGHSLSEEQIQENLDKVFAQTEGRVITATFSSLLNRLQQLITLSEKHGRKVALEGYSMRTNIEAAQKLGHIKVKKGTLLKTKDILSYPDNKITILCTGAQGEGNAVLMRVVNGEHPHLKIQKGDTVIFSSSVIPGNERTVQFVKDKLYRQGANVFHHKMMDIHASGHGNQEEKREMIRMTKPKFFMPMHGQFSMLVNHETIAKEEKYPKENIALVENGDIVTLSKDSLEVTREAVQTSYVMVDGLGVGDVGEVVLRDRQSLAQDGMFVIIAVVDRQTGRVKGSPDIISRGFIYLRESKDLLRETRKKVIQTINKAAGSGGAINWVYVRDSVRNATGEYLYEKTQRRPMVLPVLIEV